jgi:hypothetical protein
MKQHKEKQYVHQLVLQQLLCCSAAAAAAAFVTLSHFTVELLQVALPGPRTGCPIIHGSLS